MENITTLPIERKARSKVKPVCASCVYKDMCKYQDEFIAKTNEIIEISHNGTGFVSVDIKCNYFNKKRLSKEPGL